MDLVAVWKDIAGGLLIAGALAAWVPKDFWKEFFLGSHPIAAEFWGPMIGPSVAVVSFVCCVCNIPLPAGLWNGGSRLGGGSALILLSLVVASSIDIQP